MNRAGHRRTPRWRPGRWRPRAGRVPLLAHSSPAGVTDEQVQIPQAQAVRHTGASVPVANEPEVVLPVQGQCTRTALVRLVEGGEQPGHAAVGGDGPCLGERGRGGGKVPGTFALPQQPRVVAQGVREHGPGTEPPVAADGREVVALRRRDVVAESRQAGQVEVGGARAHDRAGGDGGAPGVGGQDLVEPLARGGRPAAPHNCGRAGSAPTRRPCRGGWFRVRCRPARPVARGPARWRRGRPRSGPGRRRARWTDATVPPGRAAPAPSTARLLRASRRAARWRTADPSRRRRHRAGWRPARSGKPAGRSRPRARSRR